MWSDLLVGILTGILAAVPSYFLGYRHGKHDGRLFNVEEYMQRRGHHD